MDDDFYAFHNLGNDSATYPEPVSMEPQYQQFEPLKEPANVMYDYYNSATVSFEHTNFESNSNNHQHFADPNDPKMVMVRQINEDGDGKDWSEEEISDLETDARNDTLPPASLASRSTNMQRHGINVNRVNNPNEPHFVNVNDLINNIGFGKFHIELIFLCGLGYIADSMWSEAITLIITPIQNEWNVDNAYLGWLAATLFSGMCVGSFVWGRTSDVVGRKFPFTLTLTIGGITGMICAFMITYNSLLFVLFCLGFGVGGNIPVDGAILAEFLPTSHRGSIMVSLSIFWALGDLISATLAWIIIPERICKDKFDCDREQNIGWRYFIFALGAINCCFLFFRLGTNESPNYLICQGDGGRRRALSVLKHIAETNACPKGTVTNNMVLQVDNPLLNRKLIKKLKTKQRLQHSLLNQQRLLQSNTNTNNDRRHSSVKSQKSKTNSFESINLGSSIHPPTTTTQNRSNSQLTVATEMNIDLNLEAQSMSVGDIISELFSNKTHGRNLRLATPIIWLAWFGSSFGLSSFGVFLPKFMSSKNIHISSVYGDALILAIASFPGPFIGAYLVETQRLGRRYTMSFSAFFISLCILIFIFVNNETGLVILACLISLLTQIFYSGLMCFTPEAYPTDIRTTASGIATAIRHVANIAGPIVTGKTFGTYGDTPLVMSALAVMAAAVATGFLPFDTRKKRLVPTVRVSL